MTENWNILGHEWAVDMLRQQIVQDSTRHAYLFAGPPGVGRRTLALRFTQALNCTRPLAPGEPCGVCSDCRQIEKMQHPDLILAHADSEGGTLKVETVREARHALMFRPYQSRIRVALFPRFQEANDSAANALLKTLEEAPSYAILILTADNLEQLLPTIVSRCEVLRLRPVPLEKVEPFVERRIQQARAAGIDVQPALEAGARLIAHISGGRPGYAVRLIEDASGLAFRSEKLGDLQALLSSTRVRKFSYAEKLASDKDSFRNALLLWLSFWRDVLLRVGGASTPPANLDRSQEIDSLAAHLPLSEARRIVSEMELAIQRLEANVNPRLLAETLLLDWPKIPG
jgi:DNA polymerase III subunit delta'